MIVDSPVGRLLIEASERGLRRLEFLDGRSKPKQRIDRDCEYAVSDQIEIETARQLREYFAGERHDFDLPLDLAGSDFQLRVWRGIAAIPYGETISYAKLAHNAGSPNAYRAAGAACGQNPVAIVVPCHRVVGSDGGLHGFGGGLPTKAQLLQLERASVGATRQAVLV